ncbi:hypothetical protein EC991_009132 [Linnemannia zychae]|nr:hypothetical protein EC991_009132 [Linnemannia zychae]
MSVYSNSHDSTASAYDTLDKKPHVIIIGAGLAGEYTLPLRRIPLVKAGIPYDVYEKSPHTRNVGAAVFLGPNVGPLFTQMGIIDEYIAKSKPCSTIRLFNERRKLDFVLDFSLYQEMSGFEGRLIPRKVLYEIIKAQVPAARIHMGKRMLWTTQGGNGVLVEFSDGSVAEGDILVGADGTYSAVRQCLYNRLKKDNKLPLTDAKDLPFSCVCIAGYTEPLDTEKFPFLNDEQSSITNSRSLDKPYSWNILPVKDNKICWNSTLYLDEKSTKFHNNFRSTDWGEGGAESMCNDVRDFPIPGGDGTLTLGDLIDSTPKDQMVKIMLEEKVFDTWYYCRTVLIGDVSDVEKAFKSYRDERHAVALQAAAHSKTMCKFYGKANDRGAALTRFVFKKMPFWLWTRMMGKMIADRPQASFLPEVPNTGTVLPTELESYRDTLKIVKAREAGTGNYAATV